MAVYKEIVTKAVIGKGKKSFSDSYTVTPETIPTTVLGCWVINHAFKGYPNSGKIVIDGSFDVNIWYSYDNDTKTNVISKKITYTNTSTVNVKNGEITPDTEVIVRSLKQPTCKKVEIKDNDITFTIEKELGIEIIGDTKAKILVEKMLSGTTIALITDAGTPGISDPGEELAAMCYEAGIEVTSLPGPAACITALTLSGLPTRRFAFEAFLPMDKKERKEVLEELVNETRTIILYEAPHKLVRTLRDLRETLGNRRMTLCRELTKKHETAFHSTIDDLIAYYEKEKPLGECVLVIEGKSREELKEEAIASWEEISVEEHMEIYEKQGMSRKDAMKQVAKDRGVSKREIYQYLVNS